MLIAATGTALVGAWWFGAVCAGVINRGDGLVAGGAAADSYDVEAVVDDRAVDVVAALPD